MSQHIPTFAALRALEATARTGRLVDAADELSVTHAAVSHQIRKLEEWFEIELFTRHGNGMRPTTAAMEYARSVSQAFGLLSNATAQLRSLTDDRPVRISSPPFFFETWLLPNIRAFWSDHPKIGVYAICTSSLYSIDPWDPETDLAIRVAEDDSAEWSGYEARTLMPINVIPLCSPSYMRTHGPIDTIDALLSCTLIDDNTQLWRRWLERRGGRDERVADARPFSDLGPAVTSATLGEGVVLAPKSLVDHHLRLGALVAMDWFGAGAVSRHYYLYWKSANLRQNVEMLRDWLFESTAQRLGDAGLDSGPTID
ncbi:MAG: LysR substrate-binding domain-containing protein [Alphaproteobacteria bacterium]